MEPINELERFIRDSSRIMFECERELQISRDPEQKTAYRREIEKHEALMKDYLKQYISACQNLGKPMSDDIREIVAARFPELLAADLQRASAALKREMPESIQVLNQLAWVLRELSHFQNHLNEWKELHNLLQEYLSALTALKQQVELELRSAGRWRRTNVQHLWRPCQRKLCDLEHFAQRIQYIDPQPFRRTETGIQGPPWMVYIVASWGELEICMAEGDDLTRLHVALSNLWNDCYDALNEADRHLHETAKDLYRLSDFILRSVEHDGRTG